MFDLDRWQEIFDTLRRNKLRSALTSLAVAWGIFMLVVLLGAGTGLQHGLEYTFRDDAVNSVWIWPGTTTLPFAGLPANRPIRFENADHERFAHRLPGVDKISSRFYPGDALLIKHGARAAAFEVRSVHPDHLFLENTRIVAGRFLDPLDLAERRKVAVLGAAVLESLGVGEEILGKEVDVGGIPHRVIGIFEDDGGDEERERVYVPITTAQAAWNGGNRVDRIMFTVGGADLATSERIATEARAMLAARYKFDPKDRSAIRVRNNLVEFQRIMKVLDGIGLFVWLIGLGTIIAGIVGVSNIMLISVKERTKELGLRKALGATPRSIITMILTEALLITGVAGYVGLLAGLGAIELGRAFIPPSDHFRNPEMKVSLALIATGLMIVAGALAGFFPARRAAAVSPVVALRDE